MSTLRFYALKESLKRTPLTINEDYRRSEIFGSNVFNETAMRQYLSKHALNGILQAVEKGAKIDRVTAEHISTGVSVLIGALK